MQKAKYRKGNLIVADTNVHAVPEGKVKGRQKALCTTYPSRLNSFWVQSEASLPTCNVCLRELNRLLKKDKP